MTQTKSYGFYQLSIHTTAPQIEDTWFKKRILQWLLCAMKTLTEDLERCLDCDKHQALLSVGVHAAKAQDTGTLLKVSQLHGDNTVSAHNDQKE